MLTAKGWEVFNKWQDIYYKELERLQKEKNDPMYGEGWCIIDNFDFIKTIDDEIGLLIFGYDDGVIDILNEWKEDGIGGDEEYLFGYTINDIINILISDGYVTLD